jgi:gluconate kinase
MRLLSECTICGHIVIQIVGIAALLAVNPADGAGTGKFIGQQAGHQVRNHLKKMARRTHSKFEVEKWAPHTLEEDHRWPTLMVIGEAKAGTTSLNEWLASRSGVCSSLKRCRGDSCRIHKEMQFWNRMYPEAKNGTQKQAVQDYLGHFPESGDGTDCQYAMDNTPRYSRVLTVPAEMKRWYPSRVWRKLRFIFVVREPVERLLSLFNHLSEESRGMQKKKVGVCGKENLTFVEYANIIQKGIQNGTKKGCVGMDGMMNTPETIASFQKHFSPKQLLTISYEALMHNQTEVLQAIVTFLDLPDREDLLSLPYANTHTSPSKVMANIRHCAVATALHAAFGESTRKLYSLVAGSDRPPMQPTIPQNFGFASPPAKFCP